MPTAKERRDETYWNTRGKIAFARERQLAEASAEVVCLTAALAAKEAEIEFVRKETADQAARLIMSNIAEMEKLRALLEFTRKQYGQRMASALRGRIDSALRLQKR